MAGRLRGGIHRCTAFVYQDNRRFLEGLNFTNKSLSFSTGGTVSNRHRFDLIALTEVDDGFGSFQVPPFIQMRINRVVVEKFSLAVEADHLAAGPETGIDSHNPFGTQRWCQQQLAQVAGKHLDCMFFGPLAGSEPCLCFHGT